MNRERLAWLPAVMGVTLGVPALAALGLALHRPADCPWGLAAVLLAATAAGVLAGRRARGRARGLLVSLATLAILGLWPEMGLRWAGFSFRTRTTIQFGFPRPDTILELDRDPELFWKLPRSFAHVNSRGLAGPDFEIPKPPGTYRVVCFGDSCTEHGLPAALAKVLNERASARRRFEAVNLGVSGYSSYQGRVLARRWVEKLEPDAGVILFGWNDHWQAYGAPDEEKARRGLGPPPWAAFLLDRSRAAQWIVRQASRGAARPLDVPRVPLARYRANLTEIGERLARAGARVILVTAASAHPRTGVPGFFIQNGFAASAEQAIELHRRYNDVVRALARARGWALVDVAREVRDVQDATLARIFWIDGIHHLDFGRRWIAERLAAAIERGL